MNKKIQSIRGMHDYLPDNIYILQNIEEIFKSILNSYGYREIRFPILEKTVLFQRTIGSVTDIVEKEMFTFLDRNNESVSMRPEGTAGCVRAMIEHSLLYQKIQKIWYIGPMFRYERPQKGRYRQFYQLGVEVFGLEDSDIEAELILLTFRFFKTLGLDKYIKLELNSLGSKETRLNYCNALVSFLERNKNFLDNECLRRLEKNPLRILDSKNVNIQNLLKKAPVFFDFLDVDSKKKLNRLCNILDQFKLSYDMNAYLVRGLDYYNHTVFEWTTNEIGAQKSICAGGRYDNLVQELGGTSVPAIGFAIGLERLVILMNKFYPNLNTKNTYIYIIKSNHNKSEAIMLSEKIHNHFPYVICTIEKKLKNLTLNKINKYIALLPKKEESKNKLIVIKNLQNGDKKITEKVNLIKNLKLFL